jgi:hypothetical protein
VLSYTNPRVEPPDHGFGRSRGGLPTKIRQLVDGHGLPLVIAVAPGQAGDAPAALPLLSQLRVPRPTGRPRTRPDRLRGDKAYSSRAIRAYLRERDITAPNGARIVEVRGWLRAVSGKANANEPVNPDWNLQIEPDPEWLDEIGVNWTTFFKVGDILMMGLDPLTDDSDQHARVATPTLHLEVNGWQQDKHPGEAPPADWTIGEVQGGQLAGLIWPYLPTVTGGKPDNDALKVGQYVRAVGSLITDIAHCHGQGGGFWEYGSTTSASARAERLTTRRPRTGKASTANSTRPTRPAGPKCARRI